MYVAMAVLPFPGLVLCFGPEGTIALEVADAAPGACDCCQAFAPRLLLKPESGSAAVSPRCMCVDVPLGLGDFGPQVRSVAESARLAELGAPVDACDVIVLPRLERTCERTVWHPPRSSIALSHIRSVVLRV